MSKEVINDMTDNQKFIVELNKLIVATSGVDRPRYVNVDSGRSGFLGFDEWNTHVDKPSGTFSGGGGTLVDTKFYSIVVVPIDERYSDGLDFRTGNPTLPALPVLASAAGGKITFTIPTHPQLGNDAVGTHDNSGGSADMIDSTANFVDDEHIGKTIFNLDDNSSATITDNTATTIVGALSGGTENDWDDGERYGVRDTEAQVRSIFAAEGDTAADAFAGPFFFVAFVRDNTTTSFVLTAPAVSANSADFNRFGPVNAKLVFEAANRVFIIGGVTENRGEIDFEETTSTRTVTDVTVTTSDFGTSQGQILRYTVSVALDSNIQRESYVTVTGMGNSDNNVEDIRILARDTANLWFEILNVDGAAEAGASGTATLDPNLFEGNVSGANQTFLSEGLVGATFVFTDSDGLNIDEGLEIATIDSVNQTFRPTVKYNGRITASSPFRIESAYSLFWSAVGNAHVFPAENVIDIPFQVLAGGVISRYLVLFGESRSIRLPIDAPEQGFVVISDTVGCTAPYSVVEAQGRLYFYDNEGFSLTDGLETNSITAFRFRDFLLDINPTVRSNLRGIYIPNNEKIRWYFALVDSVTNDHGFEFNVATGDIYPLQRLDVNAVWIEPNANGNPRLHHGSTARHGDSGNSYIWQHDEDFEDDGIPSGSEFEAVVTDISGLTAANYTAGTASITIIGLNTDFVLGGTTVAPFLNEAVQFIVRSNTAVFEARGAIKSMAETGSTTPKSFIVTISSDYDIGDELGSGVQVGQFFHMGIIKVVYGPKFEDFGSPRFLHHPRQTQLDFEPSGPAQFFLDHFKDGISDVIRTSVVQVTPAETKAVANIRSGKMYSYGFRVRSYAAKRIKIQNISILWHTPV